MRRRLIIAAAAIAALLAGCTTVTAGSPRVVDAPDARLTVQGASGDHFDVVAKNALSDIMTFWRGAYPRVSAGRSLTPLKGGLYSVDGRSVAETRRAVAPVTHNACVRQSLDFVIDNGAYCRLDDSIAFDRAPTHLFARLAAEYGDLMVALIFAHEFGHSISARLGVFDRRDVTTIDTESQADCAAGAWAGSALAGQDAHFRNITPARLDAAMEGYLNGRDSTPDAPDEVSHGNGFDRLSAVADGIAHGVTYCFSSHYFDRTFTERPFTSAADYDTGGNSALAQVTAPTAKNVFAQDLNRFWTTAAQTIGKTFAPVALAPADHPPCAERTQFAYCPDTNTVYFSPAFARSAYYSLPAVVADGTEKSQDVRIADNQPGDFAFGVLLSIAWGLAVRHQLFGRSLDDGDALTAAVCYSGSYAKDVNLAADDPRVVNGDVDIFLSPADLDEAVSSMLDQVGRDDAFGDRGTTGLGRVQDFVRGYQRGLAAC